MSYYIGIVSESGKKVDNNCLDTTFEKILDLKETLQDEDQDESIYIVISGEDPNRRNVLEYAHRKEYKSIIIDNPRSTLLDEMSEQFAYKLLTNESFEKNIEDFQKNIDVAIFFGTKLPSFVKKHFIDCGIPTIKVA